MRIVFMGNPAFAVPSLSSLYKSNHEIITIVTNPDKPQGRGRRIVATPVATFGRKYGIPLLQPEFLKDENFHIDLQKLEPDLFVVVAFKILPKKLLQIPKIGSVNLHGSILPKYRGAAPIQWALINGDSMTGLTTFFLKPKVDTGDMILQKRVVIFPDDNYGNLSRRMSYIGADLLLETIQCISDGVYHTIPQNEEQVTRAPKITPEICQIDWSKSVYSIYNLIRALSPSPTAFTYLDGKRLKIFRTRISGFKPEEPGQVLMAGKQGLIISCGEGSLRILELQLEGKRRMSSAQFVLGSHLSPGTKLG